MENINQLMRYFLNHFAYLQWLVFAGISGMLFLTTLVILLLIRKRGIDKGHIFLTSLSGIYFLACCYALHGIEQYVPQYMSQDELLRVIAWHVFAIVLAIVLYIQRKAWIRVFVGVALVPMMLMMWTIKSMWMDAVYLPKVVNTEFQNMSQKERNKEYNPDFVSEETGLQFPQAQVLDYKYERMGPDYVTEYKWRFKAQISKETMQAMDKLVAKGKWMKLKNGAYFMPIRDYRGVSPQGVYIYPKQRIARYAYDGGTNGFFGSPDEYQFMLK